MNLRLIGDWRGVFWQTLVRAVDEAELLSQLHRWRDEAEKRLDCQVSRICVAYEAGRDGFWLAHFLRGSGIEAHVMHSTSIPVKRDHRRAKTDRLDCQLMMRAFLGWLRREAGHCRMVAVPTAEQEDARRVTRERKGLVREQTKLINRLKAMFACLGIRDFKPHLKRAPERLDGLLTPEGDPIPANTLAEIRRAMDRLVLVRAQIKEVEDTRAEKIAQDAPAWHHAMVGKLATIHGLGVDTADMIDKHWRARDEEVSVILMGYSNSVKRIFSASIVVRPHLNVTLSQQLLD